MPTFWKNLNKIHLIFQIIYRKHAPWTANFQFLAKSLVLKYSIKFHEILTSGSVEISAFPLNCAVTTFWLTAHALYLTGFSIFLDPYKQSQKGRVFSNRTTFNTLKSKRFWHITNCLIVKTKNTLGQSSLNKIKWSLYRHHVFFSQSLVRALIHVSSTNRRAHANCVQTP